MAKICSSYGSTPPFESLLNSDWGVLNNMNSEELFDASVHFKPDPDMNELFGGFNDYDLSISADIQKMTTDDPFSRLDNDDNDDDFTNHNSSLDGESKVRNKNCMWSGTTMAMPTTTTPALSTSASSSVSDNGTSLPLAVVAGGGGVNFKRSNNTINSNSNNSQQQPTVVVASKKLRNNSLKLLQHQQQQQQNFFLHTSIKVEPVDDDYEQQLQQHNIPNSKTLLKETATQLENLQHIPPGTSLLRKSATQQQQQQQQQQMQQQRKQQQQNRLPSMKIPTMCPADFVRERDQLLTAAAAAQQQQQVISVKSKNTNNVNANTNSNNVSLYGRPDTPHSLDDESALMYSNHNNNNSNDNHHTIVTTATGFTHNVDLRACIMGSNNISLPATDPQPLIDQLSQQLQDTSKDQLDLALLGSNHNNRSLADVLDYIGCNIGDSIGVGGGGGGGGGSSSSSSNNNINTSSTDKMTKSMRNLRTSDYDSDDDDDVSLTGSSCDSLLSSHLNEDSMCSKMVDYVIASNSGGISPATSPNSSSSSSSSPQYPVYRNQQIVPTQSYLHSDHSYTRCKDGMDDLGNLETPSDSDEEIDVVSIGDKKLPTNPSDKDRRAIQTKFAHKISNSRVVKNPNGIRTIPPRRRRGSFELPYTPASSSPVKSVANSRYPSPASTPYHNQYTNNNNNNNNSNSNNNSQNIILNGNGITATATTMINEKSRKRINGILNNSNGLNNLDLMSNINASSDYAALPPIKKCRSKKQQQQQQQQQQIVNANATLKRHYSFDETADTIEKRNLHNDMERQRRIGLKNLFDALKKQIPSIKDKERAPKVNILREAAKLCEALTREDEQLSEQKALLREQLRMRQELLERLRNLKQE